MRQTTDAPLRLAPRVAAGGTRLQASLESGAHRRYRRACISAGLMVHCDCLRPRVGVA